MDTDEMTRFTLIYALLAYASTASGAEFQLPNDRVVEVVRSGEEYSTESFEGLSDEAWSLIYVDGYQLAKRDIYKGLYDGDINRDAVSHFARQSLGGSSMVQLVTIGVARDSSVFLASRSRSEFRATGLQRTQSCGDFHLDCSDTYLYLHSESPDYTDTVAWLRSMGVETKTPNLPVIFLVAPGGSIAHFWYANGTDENAMPPLDLLLEAVARISGVEAVAADLPRYRQKLVDVYGSPGYETQWAPPGDVLEHQRSIGLLAPLVAKD